MTKEEIDQKYREIHDELSAKYYSDRDGFPGGKEAFDTAHAKVWTGHLAELLAEGHMEPLGPSIDDRVKALEDQQ